MVLGYQKPKVENLKHQSPPLDKIRASFINLKSTKKKKNIHLFGRLSGRFQEISHQN
jgi:hypothetical protein